MKKEERKLLVTSNRRNQKCGGLTVRRFCTRWTEPWPFLCVSVSNVVSRAKNYMFIRLLCTMLIREIWTSCLVMT